MIFFLCLYVCVCVCACVSFTLILLFSSPPLFISFHQGRTPTAPIQKASPVVFCLILSVCILPRAQVKPLSELDFKVKADVVVSDGVMRQILHVRAFYRELHALRVLRDSHLHLLAPTRDKHQRVVLCPRCCAVLLCCVISLLLLMLPYVFPCSLWAGGKLQNLLLNENAG